MRIPVSSVQPEYYTDTITTSHLTDQIVSSRHHTTIVRCETQTRQQIPNPSLDCLSMNRQNASGAQELATVMDMKAV